MKILQTVVALLATAILCIVLASCDIKLTKSDKTSTGKHTEETVDTFAIIDTNATNIPQTEENTAMTSSTMLPGQSTAHNSTTVAGTTAVAPTKVSTTVPATTKPAVTTTVPSTTVPSTTAVTTTAPVETTVPLTTSEPTTVPPAPERPTDIVTDSEDMDSEQKVIANVNRYRVAEGLGELSYSPEFSAAAKVRAKELAVSYSHMRPDGTFFFTIASGVKDESIAKGYATADEVTASWASSEGYKNLMLNKTFTKTGVGCYYDSSTDTYYWVQLFG